MWYCHSPGQFSARLGSVGDIGQDGGLQLVPDSFHLELGNTRTHAHPAMSTAD